MKKFDMFSKAKFVLIGLLALVVIGAVIFGVFGFNNSPAFGTGYEITVKTESAFPGNADKILEVVDGELSYDNYYMEEDFHSLQVFEVSKKVSAEKINALKTKIDKAINEGSLNPIDIEVSQNEIKSSSEITLWQAGVVTAVVLVIAMAYLMIRQRFAGAFAVALSAIAEGLIFTALVAVTRTVVTQYLYAVLALSVVITLFASVLYTADARSLTKKQAGQKALSAEDAFKSLECKNGFISLVVAVVVLLIGALMLAFGPAIIRWVGLSVVLASVAIFATLVFVVPSFRYFFAKIGENRRVNYKGNESSEN